MTGRRKFVSQMTDTELHSLLDVVRHLDNPTVSGHAQSKMSLEGVKKRDIAKVLREGSLVEYNIETGVPRVMVKGDKVAVVVSLETKDVVTVWRERGGHPSLKERLSVYNKDLEVTIP